MGYLITQVLIYLVLAAIIGFLTAWVLRGTRLGRRIDELESELWRVRREAPLAQTEDSTMAQLRAQLEQAQQALAGAKADCDECQRELARLREAPARRPEPAPAPAATPVPAAPGALRAPQGKADDLKRIKGIGPKIEATLHGLGIYHFHQIAGWSTDNVDWVNEHLRFKGRIQRERWIEQARELTG